MRKFTMAAMLAALTMVFVGLAPADAKARKRSRKSIHRLYYGNVSNPANHARPSAKSRSGHKAGASTRGRSSSRNRVFKTYSYRIVPGSSSRSFSAGPSSSGSGRYSTSEFLVWPNGL
jgi:hypothetical protein